MNALQGLSTLEASARLRAFGYNELPQEKPRTFFRLLMDVVREPMFLLLLACGSLYFVLGNIREASMLLGFVFVVIGITFYQQHKTEKALAALRNLSSPRALVIRDGEKVRIAGREVVADDILLLAEGDRVSADAVILTATNFYVDESLLTGESEPVKKISGDKGQEGSKPVTQVGAEEQRKFHVYSGTLAVKGVAIAKVCAIGAQTELGKIGKVLQAIKTEKTALQHEIKKLVKKFTVIGLSLCALLIMIFGITRGHWARGFLSGLSLAMASLPEEFPVVLTVFIALGAWRISRRQVLTRHLPAVEIFGATTTLCVDKTGTLTQNKMSIAEVCVEDKFYKVNSEQAFLTEELHQIVEYAILATPSNPFDPMEKAIKELGERTLRHTEHLHKDWVLLREYPLSEKLLAVSHVWKSRVSEEYIIAAKGAPEAIIDLCHLKPELQHKVMQCIAQMADKGLRVIGVARAKFHSKDLPKKQHDFDFEFLGLLGLSDPIRSEVPKAIAECYAAGIRVMMITGDYAGTAKNIAKQIGLKFADNILTGAELDKMNDAELQQQIKNIGIFARVVPEQKLRIVNALKASGNEVIAMTGDGVNDAPALKAAHIGIAMGGRGTDVAREASSMVLLDDNFASIVAAIRMGRRVFANLQKALTYIIAVHIPIVGLAVLPVLFFWPLFLLPMHIVFLELIIDPACSIVFEMEEEEPNIMQKPPRSLLKPLFARKIWMRGLTQGLVALLIVAAIYFFALFKGYTENEARAVAFINLVAVNLALIFTNRSWVRSMPVTLRGKNFALWWVIVGAVGFLILTLAIPFLRNVFQFAFIGLQEIALCFGTVIVTVGIIEFVKFILQRSEDRGQMTEDREHFYSHHSLGG